MRYGASLIPGMKRRMNNFRADLHCHTNCSDGSLKPAELIQLAADQGLKGLSITDHDTIAAYEEAVPAAKDKNIQLISGVEFSTVHRHVSIHLLAYSFPLDSPPILKFCQDQQKIREERNLAILDLLDSYQMPLEPEDFPEDFFSSHSNYSFGRPHIAMAMKKRGYVKSIQQAFHEFIGDGRPCYVAGKRFSVEESLEIIHAGKGLAVIAHPHLIDNPSVLKDLLSMNFDGLEGYYSRFNLSENERWIKIGKRKGWIIVGGSDFHGDIREHIALGCSWVGEETFQLLKDHYEVNAS